MSFLEQPGVSQKDRFLRWNGDIAEELLLISLQGNESLFSSYKYEMRSLTRKTESEIIQWHGKPVSCRIGDGSKNNPHRYLHGIVTQIRYTSRIQEEAECIFTLEPSFSLLKLGRVMRVWQKVSVPDLVSDILREHGIQVNLQLHGNYTAREYCVQYRQSDYEFIHRLLEEEGIYYFYIHSEYSHTLVLADHPASHNKIIGSELAWHHQGRILSKGNVDSWASTVTLLPASVKVFGFNMQQAATISNHKYMSTTKTCIDDITFTDVTLMSERSLMNHQTQTAISSQETNCRSYEASVNAYWLCSGETFSLVGHPSDDATYRIQSLNLQASNNFENHGSYYKCSVVAMLNDQAWCPPQLHPPAEISGVLTATVVGPSSEDIHTDEYGRIKIQFPWDDRNPYDDTSSCWVRVVQSWAGGKFGAQFIPRVGSEVIVSFTHGHPDHPLVTGTVYNGKNKPPFTLPNEKNESGFYSRSSTNGTFDEGHRLSFSDKKGEELLTVIAQKDMSLTVKNNLSTFINANRDTELKTGNDQLVLKHGDLRVDLQNGNDSKNVKGNSTVEIENGNYSLKILHGSGSIKADKSLILESDQSIELKVGNNKISLTTSGISINGSMIGIQSNGTAELKGSIIKIAGTGVTEIKGAMVKAEASGVAELKGAMTSVSGGGMTQITGGIINIG